MKNNTNTTGNEYDLCFCRNFCFKGKVYGDVSDAVAVCICLLIFPCVFVVYMMAVHFGILCCVAVGVLIVVPLLVLLCLHSRNVKREIFLDREGKFYVVEFGIEQGLTKAFMMDSIFLFFTQMSPLGDKEEKELREQWKRAGIQAQENAQTAEKAAYYVERKKQGIQDYSRLFGGNAKVTYLESFALYKKGRRTSTYTYIKNGKTKKIRLSNQYKGLVDFMSIRGR